MNTFTNRSVSDLRHDINHALAEVAKKHGINLSISGIRYSPTECTTKITAVCAKDRSGQVMQPYEKAFHDKKRVSVGMKNLGDTFISRGKTFSITGWKPRNRVYPLLAIREDGRLFKFPSKYAFIT